MNNQPARHPLIPGPFLRSGDEIKAARGKASSRDFEVSARKWDVQAEVTAHAMETHRKHRDAYHLIADDPEIPVEVRAEAQGRADYITKTTLPNYEQQLEERRGNAEQQRRYAQQARDFEARFTFDVYTDPALDALEKQQRESKAEKPKRKARL